MKHFSIGDKNIKFTFYLNQENHLVFYDETNAPLTPTQAWLLKNKSNPVEIQIAGHPTSQHVGDRHIFTSENETLCYVNHHFEILDNFTRLMITQKNNVILVHSYYDFYPSASTIRCYNEVVNISNEDITIEYVSSFAKKDALSYHRYFESELWLPHNSWYLECQWKSFKLSDLGIVSANEIKNFKKFAISNTGAWSTKSYLPMGILSDKKAKKHLLWQIEANGSWTYEIGDYLGNVTLNLSGPSLQENGWTKTLKPNETFATVKVALTQSKSFNHLFDNMTQYRRQIISNDFDHQHCPIIFNEYMFASWNCPSHQTALSLAPTAKKLGADYYVIDCGWHDEIENPFYHVGHWEESRQKYPEGLKKTIDFIRSLGLKPGLWLEPEVVGAQGDAISIWDESCYFHRNGKPLIVSNRYQLNFSHPKVTEFFVSKIDDLVTRYGIEYFKFDYNIEPGVGFDHDNQSYGEALLEHNRAYHQFMSFITKRHPNVIFEGCASGGNRLDYLTLDNVNLVSTSDQTDYLIYPYIVANILTAVLPTQAAIWCYPKIESLTSEDTTYEQINMNIMNCLIGRVHLASKLNLLNEDQQDFIQRGLAYYHQLDELRNHGFPYFPLGLVSFGDGQFAFGIKSKKKALLLVYNIHGDKAIRIPLGQHKSVTLGFPTDKLITDFIVEKNTLIVRPHQDKMARSFEIDYE